MHSESSSRRRNGIDPVLVLLPDGGTLAERVHSTLSAKNARVTFDEIAEAIDAGDVGLVDSSTAFVHRPVPDEVDIELPVLLETERLIAVDKPSGISTTPQGSFVARSVLVQARRRFGDVSCAHRLDRATSGVMLLVKDAEFRGTYQSLFENGLATKTYEFFSENVTVPPPVYRSRLESVGQRTAQVDGEPNAVTELTLLEDCGGFGRYRALPRTGKTHQIRVHAVACSIPIIGDTLYGPGDGFPDRIELLARTLEFIDPVDGKPVRISSRQELQHQE